MNCSIFSVAFASVFVSSIALASDPTPGVESGGQVVYQARPGKKVLDHPIYGHVTQPFLCRDVQSGAELLAEWAMDGDIASTKLFVLSSAGFEKSNPITQWLESGLRSGRISSKEFSEQYDFLSLAQKRLVICAIAALPEKSRPWAAALISAIEFHNLANNNQLLDQRGLFPASMKVYRKGRTSLGLIPILKSNRRIGLYGGTVEIEF